MAFLDKKAALTYWIGSILQMFLVCAMLFILRVNHINYPQVLNLVCLIVGGTSSALWGIIISVKHNTPAFKILYDFFNVKQSLPYYSMVFIFVLILFGMQVVRGNTVNNVQWYTFFILFAQAIIFGGIEEIGWRYTWQPMIEKRVSFEVACVCTFGSWGLWHYMYFYLTNSLSAIHHTSFLIGLLGSCFILGAIYRVSRSLWLCVFYHCLFNVFSQILVEASLRSVMIGNAIAITLSIVIVRKWNARQAKNEHSNSHS